MVSHALQARIVDAGDLLVPGEELGQPPRVLLMFRTTTSDSCEKFCASSKNPVMARPLGSTY
jgi:hypothetical protein